MRVYGISGKIININVCLQDELINVAQRLASLTGLKRFYDTNANNPLEFFEECPYDINWDYHEELLALSKEFPRIKFRFELVDENDHCWREYYWDGQYARDDSFVVSVLFDNPPLWANETEPIAYVRQLT